MMTRNELLLGLIATAILAAGYALTYFLENSYAIL